MAGTKRGADSDGPSKRASKVAKTDDKPASKAKKGGAKKGATKAMATSAFKSKALPLHVNLTHTPPSIPDADTVPVAPTDPGFLGSLTLVPSEFNTKSYGWKGNKRLTIEIGGEGEEKEKVTVQLTINATVMGSKGAKKGDKEDEEEKDKEAEAAEEEAADAGDEE
ncbi:hypothetical protein FB45DRAFT_931061 [Roridomyces roridus]|uniref:Uncharacterized protein n=1 Tax=Roridomyces roridus TaxID=1738132 RepID=A0AAD7BG29_9AGAR|nr:hypothetical protein FB45DRAFT_931061 [Roridomyces roridus]